MILRSVSSEMASKGSMHLSSKSVRGHNFPMESSDSKAGKVFDKKPSTKSSSLNERRVGRGPEIQPQMHQLQEELRKMRDEKTRALEDLEELRSNKKLSAHSNKEAMEVLEKKVERAKESERKMLESLISQTKQFEQTKILLEEAKLEIQSLQDNIKSLEETSSRNNRVNAEKQQSPELVRAREEIVLLRNELKLATQAEEKSKKAMDDLAIALKEVSTEANQVKASYSKTQLELERVKSEADQSMSLLKMTDDKLRAAIEESERLKLEVEDLVAVLKEKENGFMNCIKASEEEISKLKLENSKMIESLRGSREETSKLRDILKQAVNEATVVKEALEIARNENSQLKDLLSQKESSLQSIKQEYECLKVSEAAAVDSVKELKGFLAATSDVESARITAVVEPTTKVSASEGENKKIMKFPSSDRLWRGNADAKAPKVPPHGRRHSVAELEKSKGSALHVDAEKNQLFPSLSNVSASRIPPSIYADDREKYCSLDFDHISGSQSNGADYYGTSSPAREKKKRTVLKKFGDILRRKSFQR